MSLIQPFHLDIAEGVLSDLRIRLANTRWPERETVADWSQGAPLAQVRALCDYWLHTYDWRRCETMLNSFGQFRTNIDGLNIHFLHVRSPRTEAIPMILTHGWPGSIIEFNKVIGPLTDPSAHGGDPADAFHLVIPSLPGYGFSDRPSRTGQGVDWTAKAWVELMKRLGYDRFVAQGGDWGAAVTTAIGVLAPPECVAIHVNLPVAFPDPADEANWNAQDRATAAALDAFNAHETGYSRQQSTRPQTLGYGLTDSPVGQAAWIYEKFHAWTDNDGDPETVLTRDEMLDNIMLYWLPGTATSSARLYWESMDTGFNQPPVSIPSGVSMFPKEILPTTRRSAERVYRQLVYWNDLDRGGHFAAFEQPSLFTEELRRSFRFLRS